MKRTNEGRSFGTWLRLYTSIVHDSTIRRDLSDTDALRYIYILAAMKEGEVEGHTIKSLAWFLRIDAADLGATIERLQAAGLLDENRIPVGWNNRQFKGDGTTSTDRVRKHRERKRFNRNDDVTFRETPQNRAEQKRTEQSRAEHNSPNSEARIGSGLKPLDTGMCPASPEAEPMTMSGGAGNE